MYFLFIAILCMLSLIDNTFSKGILRHETSKSMLRTSNLIKRSYKKMNGPMNYELGGGKWNKNTLTYRISRYSSDQGIKSLIDQRIKEAFETWSNVTNLKFINQDNKDVDINIRFTTGEHGDGGAFEGAGGVLAHAISYYIGETEIVKVIIDFDDEEPWHYKAQEGICFLDTAVHEIGHALGLGHSENRDAVMYAFFVNNKPPPLLHSDDIKGIQKIYGNWCGRAKGKATLKSSFNHGTDDNILETPPFLYFDLIRYLLAKSEDVP